MLRGVPSCEFGQYGFDRRLSIFGDGFKVAIDACGLGGRRPAGKAVKLPLTAPGGKLPIVPPQFRELRIQATQLVIARLVGGRELLESRCLCLIGRHERGQRGEFWRDNRSPYRRAVARNQGLRLHDLAARFRYWLRRGRKENGRDWPRIDRNRRRTSLSAGIGKRSARSVERAQRDRFQLIGRWPVLVPCFVSDRECGQHDQQSKRSSNRVHACGSNGVKRGSRCRARPREKQRIIQAGFSPSQWQMGRVSRRIAGAGGVADADFASIPIAHQRHRRLPQPSEARMMAGMHGSIYLDHSATTPVLPEVIEAMRACYAEPYLNPASQHGNGRRARRKLEDARERIAELLGANTTGVDADRLIFTSGGTESNNLALFGISQRRVSRVVGDAQIGATQLADAQHVIISPLEHPSIYAAANELARRGHEVARLGANRDGIIQAVDLSAVIRPTTRLVAAILGQNETGVLQPVAELAAICREHNVPIHTDAAQVIGKFPVNFRELGVATMAVAAHKFHGPLGIGAIVVRHGVELAPQLFGGFQQGGTRPGTESVALAVGMRQALELWHSEQQNRTERMRELRDNFERGVVAGYPDAVVIGANAERLPHVSNIAFVGLDRQAVFMALDQAGVACSTGSACASGSSEPSPALVAMGLESAVISSALRFSFGATTTAEEMTEAVRRILQSCNYLRRHKQV
jgi:cysteine desulfurase